MRGSSGSKHEGARVEGSAALLVTHRLHPQAATRGHLTLGSRRVHLARSLLKSAAADGGKVGLYTRLPERIDALERASTLIGVPCLAIQSQFLTADASFVRLLQLDKMGVVRRPSTCNCVVTHGLQNHTRTRPPSPPSCMYDVLASNEAKELAVGEVGPALQLTGRSVYLAPSGTFFCQHKTRLVPITKAARPYVFKAEGGKCHCSLALPRRAAKLRLGRL